MVVGDLSGFEPRDCGGSSDQRREGTLRKENRELTPRRTVA